MLTECEHGGVVGSQNGNQFRCTECDRSGPQLDLSDPEIREMAERNHTPSEVWTNSGQLYGVLCDQCGHEWPCPTRMALRAPRATQDCPRGEHVHRDGTRWPTGDSCGGDASGRRPNDGD